MPQRRNRRSGVEDRWTKTVRDADGTVRTIPSAANGQGMRWRARYVDDDGREHSKGFRTKAEASGWLNEITAAQVTGTYVAPRAGLLTVGAQHAKWVGTQGHLKATTVSTRTVTWSAHVETRWSAVAVADVHTSDVRAWVQDMVTDGAGAATVENALSVLRQVLALAVDDKRLPRNPCDGVKPPRRQHRPRGYLTHDQVEQLACAVGVRHPGAAARLHRASVGRDGCTAGGSNGHAAAQSPCS